MSTSRNQKRRSNGEGSIRKKENGTYLGRISIAGYPQYSCTGKTEKEVQKKLRDFRVMTLRGEIIPQKQSVSSYIERWLEQVKQPSLKPASYDRLERTYLNIILNEVR